MINYTAVVFILIRQVQFQYIHLCLCKMAHWWYVAVTCVFSYYSTRALVRARIRSRFFPQKTKLERTFLKSYDYTFGWYSSNSFSSCSDVLTCVSIYCITTNLVYTIWLNTLKYIHSAAPTCLEIDEHTLRVFWNVLEYDCKSNWIQLATKTLKSF